MNKFGKWCLAAGCSKRRSRGTKGILCRDCFWKEYRKGMKKCVDCFAPVTRPHCNRCLRCSKVWMRGENIGSFKGGRRLNWQGYIRINVDGNRKLEHRYVVEQKIGRKLKSHELVHHINGVKHDNRIGNLAVVNSQTHESGTFAKILQRRIRELENNLK